MRTFLIAAALASVSQQAAAQSQPETDAQRISRLEAQVEALTKRLEQVEAEKGSPQAPATQRQAAQTADRATANVARSGDGSKPAPAGGGGKASAASGPGAKATDTVLAGIPVGPANGGPTAPDRSSLFQITASTGSSQASFAVTRTVSRPNFGSEHEGMGTYTALTIGAQAPISTGGGDTKLATLDGLANSFALKFGISQFRVRLQDPGEAMAALETKAVAACNADPGVDHKTACDVDTNRQGILSKYLTKEEYESYLSGGFPDRSAFVFGLNASVGYKKLTYLDAMSGTKNMESHVPWSVGGYVTWLPNLTATSLTFGVDYQQAWKEQTTGTVCPVAVPPTATLCATGAVGAPTLQRKVLLSVGGRKLFATDISLLPTIGVAPQFTYDANADQVGIDVPIYLVSDDKKGLVGGISTGWANKGTGFTVGVFVGSSFSIFK